MEHNSSRIFGLDLMRSVAIIMVLLSHASGLLLEENHVLIHIFEFIGMHGVEVFFVLSGFLIGTILLKLLSKGNFSGKVILFFWVRRWFRTLPLYFLILILNIILIHNTENRLSEGLWQFPFFVQNLLSKHPLFFSEAWSLSVEEYAYMFSPLIIWCVFKKYNNPQKAFFISTLVLTIIFMLTKVLFYLKNINEPLSIAFWDNNLKEVVIYRLDAIYYGFVIAYLHFYKGNWLKKNKYHLLILAGMSIIVNHVMFLQCISQEEQSFYLDVIFLPMNSIAICMILPFLYYIKKTFNIINNIIYRISIYSYSIYLIHFTFMIGLLKISYTVVTETFIQKLCYVFVYLIMTFVISCIVYHVFEKPMTNLRDHKFFNR